MVTVINAPPVEVDHSERLRGLRGRRGLLAGVGELLLVVALLSLNYVLPVWDLPTARAFYDALGSGSTSTYPTSTPRRWSSTTTSW